jgi:hypothetical protein
MRRPNMKGIATILTWLVLSLGIVFVGAVVVVQHREWGHVDVEGAITEVKSAVVQTVDTGRRVLGEVSEVSRAPKQKQEPRSDAGADSDPAVEDVLLKGPEPVLSEANMDSLVVPLASSRENEPQVVADKKPCNDIGGREMVEAIERLVAAQESLEK